MGWILLIAGLLIWSVAHLFRAFAPNARAQLYDRLGPAARGLIGAIIIASVILMVLGYRATPFITVWSPPPFLTHVNNLLMIFAFYVYLLTATKPGAAFVMGSTKNPQLTGFKIWAVAHLLVNGDLAAILLFGGLLAWAVVQVVKIKRLPQTVDRETAPITSPIVHLAVSLAVVGVVMGLHYWIGVTPWG